MDKDQEHRQLLHAAEQARLATARLGQCLARTDPTEQQYDRATQTAAADVLADAEALLRAQGRLRDDLATLAVYLESGVLPGESVTLLRAALAQPPAAPPSRTSSSSMAWPRSSTGSCSWKPKRPASRSR